METLAVALGVKQTMVVFIPLIVVTISTEGMTIPAEGVNIPTEGDASVPTPHPHNPRPCSIYPLLFVRHFLGKVRNFNP